ncbi:MAG: hypothetical protein ONB23_12115 [candidate division KSB1 bacterium]|nr:hypothetical protein [candidate division KSB1 bacterium]
MRICWPRRIAAPIRVLGTMGLFVSGLVLWPLPGLAQYGGYGAEFLRYGVGGRALGLGGAFTGVADDASAIFYNPAGLLQMDRLTLSYMTSNLYLGARYQFGAIAYPFYTGLRWLEKVVVGAGYVQFGMEGFELREGGTHRLLGSFADRQQAFVFPVGFDWASWYGRFAFAGEVNVLGHELAGYSDQGWGFGFSALVQLYDLPRFLWGLERLRLPLLGEPFSLENMLKWRFGFMYRELPALTLFQEREDLPEAFRIGVSYVTPFWNSRFWLLGSWDRVAMGAGGARSVVAGELGSTLVDEISLRARFGYRLGERWQGQRLVWGAGLSWVGFSWGGRGIGPVRGSLSIDFVRQSHAELGSTGGFYLSLQLVGGREDVVYSDVLSSREPGRLWRTLSWHPRDPRRIGLHAERERVDDLYRDGSITGRGTGVAEILRSRYDSLRTLSQSERDSLQPSPLSPQAVAPLSPQVPGDTLKLSHTTERLDDFLLGFGRLINRALRALTAYRNSLGRDTALIRDALKQFEARREKLAKCYNALALRCYLDLCVVADPELGLRVLKEIVPQNKCFPSRDSVFFAALLGDEAALRRYVAEARGDTLAYVLLLLGMARQDSQALAEAAEKGRAFAFSTLPMAPLLADGTVADDALLLLAARENSSDERKRRLVELLVEFPGSDAALIASGLDALSTQGRPGDVQQYYRDKRPPEPWGVIDGGRVLVEGLTSRKEVLP